MRDLRKYARNTTIQLIAGGLALLVIIGIPLINWIYGSNAAILGLICISAGLAPILIIILILWILDWISKRANRD